jgi:uncharacterized protein (DUF2249 family)
MHPPAPTPRHPRLFDVRPLLAAGGEPLAAIMAIVTELTAGDTLVLTTPFLPSPLIEKLQAEGFEARPERRADGAWETRFRRDGTA